jgi:hypothetical protein
MLKILLNNRTAWNDYFPGIVPSRTYEKQETSTRQSFSDQSVYVLSCLFTNCKSSSNGGALHCSASVAYFLVGSSSFFSCNTSSRDGGAIYFENTGSGPCVLNEVCCYNCYSTYGSYSCGMFAYIRVYDSTSSKNYVNYSSFTRCRNENSGSCYPVYLEYGKTYCTSVNVSMNKCHYQSGIICYPSFDSISVSCSISYSSFIDNNAFGYNCIYLYRTGTRLEIICSNIIRNTQGSPNTQGTIYANGNMMIQHSCILENDATYIFCAGSNSIITVSQCTVDSTNHYNSFVLTNTITKSFINALDHISTQNCIAEYDSVGILTVIEPPKGKKKVFCNTCNCRAVSDFFSLTFVFLVTFIHSNPYGNLNYNSRRFY